MKLLSVNQRCLTDRNKMSAIVIKTRITSVSKEIEYYLHYENFDKRLDEWVHHTAIKEILPPLSTPDPPIQTVVEKQPIVVADSKDDKITTRSQQKAPKGKLKEVFNDAYEALENERELLTSVKNIDEIYLGGYLMDTWYFSPYPEEFCNVDCLYICEWCLKYFKFSDSLIKHSENCLRKSPPGIIVYEKDDIRLFELDGKLHKLYCQNLCLLGKLFVDHKTIFYDLDPFLFYVLVVKSNDRNDDDDSFHLVGYFSKEKISFENFNLACILVLPSHQKKGYGRLQIEFSYELSKIECKIGSPESPLSDLGYASYRSFWTHVIKNSILSLPKNAKITLKELSALTSVRQQDLLTTIANMDGISVDECSGGVFLNTLGWDNLEEVGNRLIDPTMVKFCPTDFRPAKKS